MAASLKGYIPALARLIQTTPAALYERQRALVRAGLLAPEDGRGPGSGVRATAPSVALLLLSALSTDRLSESDARTRVLAGLHPGDLRQRCPYTGMQSFGDALATLLVGTGKAAGVREITVSRTAERASFSYLDRDSRETRVSQFVGANGAEPGIGITASLSHNLLMQISHDVRSIVLESFNREEQGNDRKHNPSRQGELAPQIRGRRA